MKIPTSINDWADYWRYDIGVNVIPADTRNKRPIIEWKQYQDIPVPEEQHNEWKANNAFSKGLAIIPGKVWHNQFKKGLYFVFIDLDNKKAIEEFCTRNGKLVSLGEISKQIIIEQHIDDLAKAHAYFYSKHPFVKKSSDRVSELSLKIHSNEIPAIEVKGLGEHGIAYCTPSVHKNGQMYKIIGSTEPAEISDLDQHIDSICRKYNIPYLDGHGNGKSLTLIQELFKEDTKIYEGHNRHEALLRVIESLLRRNYGILTQVQIKQLADNWNQQHCVPPPNYQEFQKQWTDATKFIQSKVNEVQTGQDEQEIETKKEQKQKQELIRIRVTEEDISFVLETMYKEAPNDKTSIDQLFFGMCSAFTKCGMSHDVNSSSSGAGKNYLLKLASSLFPRKYVEQFAGVSDKAFFHRRRKMVIKNELTGELEFVGPIIDSLEKEKADAEVLLEVEKDKPPKDRDKEVLKKNRSKVKETDNKIRAIKKVSQKLIIIGNLIIILLDTPQEGFFATLMSLVSGDTEEDQEYLFTDKTASGKNEASSNIIRGRPTMFIAHVTDDTWSKRFAEKNRRFIPVTPDTSKEKINDAMRLMSKKAGLLPEQYGEQIVSEDDKQRAKKTVAAIAEKLQHHSKDFRLGEYGNSIPFQAALAESILAEKDGDVWRMTVKKRTEEYLAIITKVYMDNGPQLVNVRTRVRYPVATFARLAKALEIMETSGTNIKAYLLEFYNKVVVPRYKEEGGKVKGDEIEKENYVGLTTEEIGEMMQRLGMPNPGSKLLRDTFLYPLSNCGLLDYEKSVRNRGQNLWFPVDPETNANTFKLFTDGDRKLTVKDGFYPSANVIEEAYSSIINDAKDSENGTGKKCYRLEDGDGTEISIEKMIEKFFSNPDSCFKRGEEKIAYH